MSEEGAFWTTLAEKFFGILLSIIGTLALYYTLTTSDALGTFTGFFGFLGIVLLVLGLFLILVKAE
ncbi:MAG: hypothetical protein ACUVUE_01320 [Candidatus Bathycorpusculaceae bacterium]